MMRLFEARFPGIPADDYVLGAFMLNDDAREHYEEIMSFPPFTVDIDRGRELWNTPLHDGKTYAQCLPNGGRMIAGNYPAYDPVAKRIVTFEMEINRCRVESGDAPYRYDDARTMGTLTAYARTLSDGMRMNIRVDGPEALAHYEAGRALYYRRIGQMNFSCANCHVDNAGKIMRMETISPAIGQATHFPVFRGGDKLYTLQARYTRCMKQVRAQPFPMGSETFNDLEYFHSYLSNGLPLKASVYRR
ncbi:MAG: sulfur oxidation c-type cytochrome SoxA [Betaproteobacteria bacterium]|nr:sulfur oxidation c-type cytochrome SoxA [Betaproteobacteria bacterium]